MDVWAFICTSGAALGNGTSLVVSSLPVTELYRDGINRSEDVVDDCCCWCKSDNDEEPPWLMRELARRRIKGLDNDWVSECVVAKLDVDLLREGKTAVFDLLLIGGRNDGGNCGRWNFDIGFEMGFKLVVDVESAATSTAAPEPVPVPEVEEDDIDGLFNDCCFNGVSFGKWTVLLDIFGLICWR